jgi:hypothetical protein
MQTSQRTTHQRLCAVRFPRQRRVVVLLAQVLGTVPSFMVPFLTESPIPVLYAPFKTYDVCSAPHLATFRIELGAWGSAAGAQSFTLH